MIIVLLCAGQAIRLYSLTQNFPGALLPVADLHLKILLDNRILHR